MIFYTIWIFLKKLLSGIKYLLAPIGIPDKAFWVIMQYFFISISFFCAVSFYFIVYNTQIPTIQHESKLYLYKTKEGYFSRVFKEEGTFPICRETYFQGTLTPISHEETIIQKTCANPIDLGACQLPFDNENYEITLKLILPQTAQNIKYGESIPVFAEFISKDHAYIVTHTEGIPSKVRFSIWRVFTWIFRFVGITEDELTVDVVISEKFVNSLFNLNVINIDIKNPTVVIRSGTIQAKVVLRGFRWFMYEWFWISLVICVTTITFWLVIFLNLVWRTIKKFTSPNVPQRKKKKVIVESDSDSDGSNQEREYSQTKKSSQTRKKGRYSRKYS